MIEIPKLIFVSARPPNPDHWLVAAEDGVDYLIDQLGREDIIIYATLEATLIVGVLAPRDKVSPPDPSDLLRAMIMTDDTWSITHVSGGGEPDRVYLAPPLDHPGCESLTAGEGLVFRRSFTSVDKGNPRTEVSQKLIHALDLYWLEEQSAFCRLDDQGDIEPVIRVIQLERQTGRSNDIVVTIRADALVRYMIVTNTVLVQKFDFTRFIPGGFGGWTATAEYKARGSDLFYNTAAQAGASYANGMIISRPTLSHADLVHEYQSKWDDSQKQYATFKAHDWKNNKLAEISCAPSALASYFEKDSPLPFQITPAFFRPEVLQRYKADPEKYSLEHRSVSSRAGWYLKTFDINTAGQVHTYLHYLGDLPYQEQLYWQAFNEWPKAPISDRAYKTDMEGEWSDIPDPLLEIINDVRELDGAKPDWWQPRGEALRDTTHYPVTTSPDEWGDSLLALDQLVVEGFSQKSVRDRLSARRQAFDKSWGSLRLIQELLVAQGYAPTDAADAMEPLRRLHFLRSKVKGHAAVVERDQLIVQARTDFGSLKDHFVQLAADCQQAFSTARDSLMAGTSS